MFEDSELGRSLNLEVLIEDSTTEILVAEDIGRATHRSTVTGRRTVAS